MKKLILATGTCACLFGISAIAHDVRDWLEVGSNEILRAPISGLEHVEGVEVIVSDVLLPAQAELPPHSHPGQEFVYLIEGEVLHGQEGKPDTLYKAGEAFVIETGAVHSPKNTNALARAIVFRVHLEGEPERTIIAEDWEHYSE